MSTKIVTDAKPLIERKEVKESISHEFLLAIRSDPAANMVLDRIRRERGVPAEAKVETWFEPDSYVNVVRFVWWEITF